MASPSSPESTPSCAGCRHLQTTYVPEQPYGCQAFGFRSRAMPARVVLQESGAPCQAKELRGQAPEGLPNRRHFGR